MSNEEDPPTEPPRMPSPLWQIGESRLEGSVLDYVNDPDLSAGETLAGLERLRGYIDDLIGGLQDTVQSRKFAGPWGKDITP